LAEGFDDMPFERPAERLRNMIDAVRRLLAGERAMLRHATTHRALRLGTTAAPHVPILAAALGPTTRRVAAESADGWFPTMTTPSSLTSVRPVMAEQRTRAGDRQVPLTVISGPTFATVGDPTHPPRRPPLSVLLIRVPGFLNTGSVSGPAQHPSQVDNGLGVDVLVRRNIKELGTGPDSNGNTTERTDPLNRAVPALRCGRLTGRPVRR
jgi:Luciferase-like monooxygenase